MATEIALPAGFGPVPAAFAGTTANDDLGAGIQASYGIIGYKGKVWSTRYQGDTKQLMRPDGDGPRNSIEVVLVKGSPAISKIYYKQGYVDGSDAAPDCWSADGIKPDASVKTKCNATCADCPMNAWGSRISEAGKAGKLCSDSRRVAVVPLEDIDNELFGGPMLLRVPAASLKDLKAYGDLMSSYQFPYYSVGTRISFDSNEAYPKFVFNAIRPLTNEEALKIKALHEGKKLAAVLNETAASVGAGLAAQDEEKKKSLFEQYGEAGAAAGDSQAEVPLSQQAKATGPADPEAAAKAAAEAKVKAAAEAKVKAAEEEAAKAAKAAKVAAAKEALRKQLEALEAEENGEVTAEGSSAQDTTGYGAAGQSSEVSGAVDDLDNLLDEILK